MEKAQRIALVSGKYILTSSSALAIFGLTLAVVWSLPDGNFIHYQLITTIFAASFAMIAGGYMLGKLMEGNHPILHACEWGVMIGFAGFGYLFGFDWKWLVALIISGTFSTLGGWFSEKNRH